MNCDLSLILSLVVTSSNFSNVLYGFLLECAPVPLTINIHDDQVGARMLQDQSTASTYSTNTVWARETIFHHAKNLYRFWFYHEMCEDRTGDLSCAEQLSVCQLAT